MRLQEEGKTRLIGVSNFDVPDLEHLLSVASEPVSANQLQRVSTIELHANTVMDSDHRNDST